MDDFVMEQVIELKLNRSDWQLVKFGDVAIQQKESVDRENTDLTLYVKGEHMGSEDLHIREWGELTDEYLGPAFIRKFEQGDILYGSRRTYLRKVAVAHFDGITSNTTFVIKANEARIDKRLLPFVMLSEGFAEHSIRNSKGSVNPYINWKDIADYEFLLPPKHQQAKLAELLWAMDDMVESDLRMLDKILLTEASNAKTIFIKNKSENTKKTKVGYIDKSWNCLTLQELIDNGSITSHLDGNHGSFYPKANEFVAEGVPYISANCINDDEISFDNAKYLTIERAKKITKGIAVDGDILLAHNATVGPVCILKTCLDNVILSTTLTYYRANKKSIEPRYLFHYMKSQLFQSQLEKVMTQSTRNQVPITTQRKLYFIIPPLKTQIEIVNNLKNMLESRKSAERKISNNTSLQKSLINQIF
jgi:restriction endonuclease S subunit